MKTVILLIALLSVAVATRLRGAGPGDEVIVIYNSRMAESKAVAEHYAQLRQVPEKQVVGFRLPTTPDISREEYEDSLQKPLARLLDKEKLWRMGSEILRGTNGQGDRVVWKVRQSRIRYLVLCYGVPIRIPRDPNLKEIVPESMRPEFRRNEASVDTELALLPMADEKPLLTGPAPNPLYAMTNAAAFDPTNGVLMVARLDGPSPEIARGLVDKALQAEKEGLWGRAYFDLRSITDSNYKMGDEWIRSAADICRRLGFETVVDENPATFPAEFPMSQVAIYCGWYDNAVSGPFTRPRVEFVPGAFAYHLHSYSAANLRSATQNWVGPFLAKGATISMGEVDEPYLGGTPEVAVFVARLIFYGMDFGRAAYAAQPVLSWQTTIVGDPLYCPFRTPAQRLHETLLKSHNPQVEWSFLRVANINLANGNRPAVVATFLENLDETRQSAVLKEKLADLYAALGKPSSAVDTYEEALKLDPSPMQRLRLRVSLSEKLAALDRWQAAYDNDLELLKENPDYPNRLAMYRKLLPLAQRLGKSEDIARYEELIKTLTPPPPPATNVNTTATSNYIK